MISEIVRKKQSAYIVLLSLVIAGVSFLTIHGISNTTISNLNSEPTPVNKEISAEKSLGLTETPPQKPESLNEAITPLEQPQAADTACKIAGCNNDLCISATEEVPPTSCRLSERAKCYQGASCQVLPNTKCGWVQTQALNRCLADSTFATQKLRVMEIRYYHNPSDIPYHPDVLSADLQNAIRDASAFQKYKNSQSKPTLEVEVVEVLNLNEDRVNVEDYWYGSYYLMIQELGLCQKIKDNKIDQIWMWVDARDTEGAPGLEAVVSSKYLLKNTNDAQIAKPPFCNGEFSFVIMGFDYSRGPELALHAHGHLMETLMRGLMSPEFFDDTFITDYNLGINGRYGCGDVHYPPNGTADYDYGNLTAKPTYCENWNPQGTGQLQSYNCTRWGCSNAGYMKWWFQNMPGFNTTATYNDKKIAPFIDFWVDLDEKIQKYHNDSRYFLDNITIGLNDVDVNSDCSCTGVDQDGQPITVNQCWQSVTGVDLNCYQCVKDTFYRVPTMFCSN